MANRIIMCLSYVFHFGSKLATALLHVNHLILTLIFNYLILTVALGVFSSVLLGYSHRAGRTVAVDATEPFEPGLYRQKKHLLRD